MEILSNPYLVGGKVGPKASLNLVGRRKVPSHIGNHIPAIYPIAYHFTDWTIAPHIFNYNEN
jgi:hypothetical protein